MKYAIILTSRLNSSRVGGKAMQRINGKPVISHLLKRCLQAAPTILAVPTESVESYAPLLNEFPDLKMYHGHSEDPLARISGAAKLFGVETVVRVTHDKIFVPPGLIQSSLAYYEESGKKYLYSSRITPGMGFEIIDAQAIHEASSKYRNVEYISYALRMLPKDQIGEFPVPDSLARKNRLLIDYPEDATKIEIILSQLGNDCLSEQVLDYCDDHPYISAINELPEITFYTCGYNAAATISRTIGSVLQSSSMLSRGEYILIDDFSQDATPEIMATAMVNHRGVRFLRNQRNEGLASSSNTAISMARGKWIMRLDADDYLTPVATISDMIRYAEKNGLEAVYPDNYFGSYERIQDGKEKHHVGGALFLRSALNHIKFTDQLRGLEGLDLYVRAKDQLKIGYFKFPTFFYSQSPSSMSKTNIADRKRIEKQILSGGIR